MQVAKALVSPYICAGSPELSLLDSAILSTKISCAGSKVFLFFSRINRIKGLNNQIIDLDL